MEWKDNISIFQQIDVRGIQDNFFLGMEKASHAAERRKRIGDRTEL